MVGLGVMLINAINARKAASYFKASGAGIVLVL